MAKGGIMKQEDCYCCNGAGYQHNKQTDINEPCRCCGGTGKKQLPIRINMSGGGSAVDQEIRG